ncbi:heterochromatin protein one [Hypoxylon argillaceum]|nr:heterochromatin protein one [Hypoxylon argillaceum]KAI1151358.1 heterochromatin protein one [Nemania diffusa]
MPPAISDDETSDVGEIGIPIATKRAVPTSASATSLKNSDDDDDNEMLDVLGDDAKGDEDEEAGDDEDLEEDEYIVEKILGHVLEADGTLKYKVKWEGYEKKSDQTWEEEENLRENAAGVLDEYLENVGGREAILEEAQTALKTKKRGRPSTGTPANGAKRRRNDSHPASETPPASARAWKPPQGSWEDHVESIDACHDENTGKLIVYLTWKDGQKTQHDTKVIYSRCPQKMLQFYERHVKIVATGSDTAKDE